MENKQKIADLLVKSGLSESDQQEWLEFFAVSPKELRNIYEEILISFPQEIGWFNEILKKKKKAMALIKEDKEAGEAAMQEIIAEEKDKLAKLFN